jgi:hypothetical protein
VPMGPDRSPWRELMGVEADGLNFPSGFWWCYSHHLKISGKIYSWFVPRSSTHKWTCILPKLPNIVRSFFFFFLFLTLEPTSFLVIETLIVFLQFLSYHHSFCMQMCWYWFFWGNFQNDWKIPKKSKKMRKILQQFHKRFFYIPTFQNHSLKLIFYIFTRLHMHKFQVIGLTSRIQFIKGSIFSVKGLYSGCPIIFFGCLFWIPELQSTSLTSQDIFKWSRLGPRKWKWKKSSKLGKKFFFQKLGCSF